MRGFIFATGFCFACHERFRFNPEKVPTYDGQPVCRKCMDLANAVRLEQGHAAHPIPDGAYEVAPA